MADAEDNTVVLTYKYRLLPTKLQHAVLGRILKDQRILYNAALQERIGAWSKAGKFITYIDQQNELTELRRDPQYCNIAGRIQRWTLKRVDDAYQGFFRRIKSSEKPGFPRFRGKARWRSFGFSEFRGITMHGNRLRFKGLPGSMRVQLHRAPPEGHPLSCSFTRDCKGWSISIQYRVPVAALPATGKQIGIDVGLSTLAMLSTGEAIPNPQHTKRAEKELRRRSRALSRCKRGSNRRKKVRAEVTRLHAKIANARSTHLHQVSARLVREHDLIAVEKLNVKGLAGGMLAKGVNDAGWTKLKDYLTYKAAYAGRRIVEVKAAGTFSNLSRVRAGESEVAGRTSASLRLRLRHGPAGPARTFMTIW